MDDHREDGVRFEGRLEVVARYAGFESGLKRRWAICDAG